MHDSSSAIGYSKWSFYIHCLSACLSVSAYFLPVFRQLIDASSEFGEEMEEACRLMRNCLSLALTQRSFAYAHYFQPGEFAPHTHEKDASREAREQAEHE